ncbi:CatB-related O-acetyltransferase [Actibacterium pelagium]|uniref:Acetyltransferase n=1 Tax=Actibacterium pelagium TaxID=2029103 RepID=A0A917EIS1_9RHOB|nr:CatB-related O-acetyltransferase [Actibacterium pelagium]GGE49934.1 acetyltransferase [Actibacterium pelagium]
MNKRQRRFLTVGRNTYGVRNIHLLEWGEGARVSIGAFCSIASNITIMLGGNHRTDWITTYPFGHINQETLGGEGIEGHPSSNGDVVIGNDVWVGMGTTIMSGVRIADGAVVAAHSVVTKDIGPYEIWGGNPAKLIRKRFADEVIKRLLDLQWWALPDSEVREISKRLSQAPTNEALNELERLVKTLKLQ